VFRTNCIDCLDRTNVVQGLLAWHAPSKHSVQCFMSVYLCASVLLYLCTQEGVFRTNCVDCLDRTNVVQGLLARHALEDLLTELGVLQPGEEVPTVLPQVCMSKQPNVAATWLACMYAVLFACY
jgi:hypothetical protein